MAYLILDRNKVKPCGDKFLVIFFNIAIDKNPDFIYICSVNVPPVAVFQGLVRVMTSRFMSSLKERGWRCVIFFWKGGEE
ncbi:MAG: hypothetical protein OEW70_04755 [candidate division WOR-3 bacterium]|nr:hypothetical protein [candidate division WOR-3 bacterium]